MSSSTIPARTHVPLALACQWSMKCAQHRVRLTLEHVYGPSGNLCNDCADHSAALGTFGPTSSHNVASSHNVERGLRLQLIRTDAAPPFPEHRSQCCVSPSVSLCISRAVCVTFLLRYQRSCSQLFFCACVLCSSQQLMESPSSSVSIVPSFDNYFVHNTWNALLELLFHEHFSWHFRNLVDEIDLARIALSCSFCSLFIVLQRRCVCFFMKIHWAPLCVECSHYGLAPLPYL